MFLIKKLPCLATVSPILGGNRHIVEKHKPKNSRHDKIRKIADKNLTFYTNRN